MPEHQQFLLTPTSTSGDQGLDKPKHLRPQAFNAGISPTIRLRSNRNHALYNKLTRILHGANYWVVTVPP